MAPPTNASRGGFKRIDPGPIFDQDFDDGDVDMTMDEDNGPEAGTVDPIDTERLVIAVDFGTTFSSVAYVRLKRGLPPEAISLGDVKCIGEYPGYDPPIGVPGGRQDVPTELWYDPGVQQSQRRHTESELQNDAASENPSEPASSSEDDSDNQSENDEDICRETIESYNQNVPAVYPGTQHWGFDVQRELSLRDIPKDEARPLARFKLMLDQKAETARVRTELAPILKSLKKKRFIKQESDIIAHYLTHLLKHTKEQLESQEDWEDNIAVEFVLCVPAKWPSIGCRVMQTAMEAAVKEVELGAQAQESVCNLFMISEPEAAAACVLAEGNNEVYYGETVVILDAGGGTVDAVTYRCTHDNPVRLSAEVVAPDSKLCGASYINERFTNLLEAKLKRETYLIKNGKSIRSIAEAKTADFENNLKRKFDTTKKAVTLESVYIDDLRGNPARGFFQNRIALTRPEINRLFDKSLKGAKRVLSNQLELAKIAEHKVKKVILTGGFGQSKALQTTLVEYLRTQENSDGREIDLIVPENPSTAVARGAVLRALDKSEGPTRITQCSYGHLLWEAYEPETCEAHRKTKCRIGKADGERYVDNTINWVIQAGDSVPDGKQFPIDTMHTFPLTAKRLICREALYVSDQRHESHYRRKHPLNKGAEKAGYIEADMTRLRDQGLIQPESPSAFSTYSNTDKKYWAVMFELVVIVEGRSLRFEARWPSKKDLRPGQQQEVVARGRVCIAAAFQLGTA